jgi:SAM-dependent methyltransferase
MTYRRLEIEAMYHRLRDVEEPVDYRGRPFDAFDLREFLDDVLPSLPMPTSEPWAFEYGTGTGAGACYLAERGFRVDAIDASPAAIELARRFCTGRGVTIEFEVGDIASLPGRARTYDLVVDNFCLHNLITDDQRQRALANVLGMLRPEAYFVIGTSVFDPRRDYGGAIRDGSTGVVYRRLPEDTGDFDDVRTIEGSAYYAHVRHVGPGALREELETAGFRVLRQPHEGRLLCARAEC